MLISRVNSRVKFLGITVFRNLEWKRTTVFIARKTQQRMFFRRQLKFNLPQTLMIQFHTAIIECIPTSSITIWFGFSTSQERAKLQRIISTAKRIIGYSLPTLQDVCNSRVMKRAGKTTDDPSHPGLLTSSRHYPLAIPAIKRFLYLSVRLLHLAAASQQARRRHPTRHADRIPPDTPTGSHPTRRRHPSRHADTIPAGTPTPSQQARRHHPSRHADTIPAGTPTPSQQARRHHPIRQADTTPSDKPTPPHLTKANTTPSDTIPSNKPTPPHPPRRHHPIRQADTTPSDTIPSDTIPSDKPTPPHPTSWHYPIRQADTTPSDKPTPPHPTSRHHPIRQADTNPSDKPTPPHPTPPHPTSRHHPIRHHPIPSNNPPSSHPTSRHHPIRQADTTPSKTTPSKTTPSHPTSRHHPIQNHPIQNHPIPSNSPPSSHPTSTSTGPLFGQCLSSWEAPQQWSPDPHETAMIPGQPLNVSKNDAGVKKAVQTATYSFNNQSNDAYFFKASAIDDAQRQIVKGIKYLLKVEISRTVCRKREGDVNLADCAFQPHGLLQQ
ncbi:hypothetical protein NFI96_019001, partial [Prochilodus magdalenae]